MVSALLIAAVPVLIQLSYWKYLSGNWLVIGYFENGEGFDFIHTHVLQGLFSFKKGWLVHTPIAAIAILCSWFLFRKNKIVFVGTLCFLAIWCYVIFSWKVWYYDGGMSARPMVEVSSAIALFLASGIEYFMGNRILKVFGCFLMAVILYLNIIQTWMINNALYPLVFVTGTDYKNSVTGIRDYFEYSKIVKSPHH